MQPGASSFETMEEGGLDLLRIDFISLPSKHKLDHVSYL